MTARGIPMVKRGNKRKMRVRLSDAKQTAPEFDVLRKTLN
jgi:hypothetical protein